jgi:hypothetical protein
MSKFSILILLLAVGASILNAKIMHQKLPWMHNKLPKTNGVIYKVTQGEGKTQQEAKTEAIHQLLFDLSANQGLTITSDIFISVEEQVRDSEASIGSSFRKEIRISNSGFEASFAKIDEVIEQKDGQYICWQVYAIADFSITPIPQFRYTTDYGMRPIVYSSLVPGWGQISKGQFQKGFIFTGSELAFLVSSIYLNSKYDYNMNRSQETSILDIKMEYVDRADKYAKYRNITMSLAGAVWIWNIIDAVSSEGMPQYAGDKKIKIQSPEQNMIMLVYSIKF